MMPTIFAIDDEILFQKMIVHALKVDGYEIECFSNGKDAIDAAKRSAPDLIITDVMMDEMNGYEVCKHVRQDLGLFLPIMVLTTQSELVNKIQAYEAGADDYLTKPFAPVELQARVKVLLRHQATMTENRQKPLAKTNVAKIIAIHSLRGGSGVTTIATNIAVGLAQIWGEPTALVDMVMTSGQSALFLNQTLLSSWGEVAQFPAEEIDDYLVQGALLPHDSGVFTLASPKRPEYSELVTPDKVTKVLSILKDHNDYIILDLPHDFSGTTLAALDMADIILTVVQPEIASARAGSMAIEIYKELGYDLEQNHLILNWTFPSKGIPKSAIEKALKKTISLVLPFASDEMLQGLNRGIPPTFSDPEKPLGMLFEDLAFVLSKVEDRKKSPRNPSEAWTRVQQRYLTRRTK